MRTTRAFTTLLLLSLPACAAGATLPNSYLAYEYGQDDYDYIDAEGSSHALLGSWELTRGVLLLGSYAEAKTRDFDFDRIRGAIEGRALALGLGASVPLTGSLSLLPSLLYIHDRTEYRGGFSGNPDTRDDGYLLELKLRQQVWEQLELMGGYRRGHLYDRDDNSLFIGGIAYPAPRLGIGARYLRTDLGANYPGTRSDRYSALSVFLQLNLR